MAFDAEKFSHSKKEAPAQFPEIKDVAQQVQILLALQLFKKAHADAVIDFEQPLNNPSEVRREAMNTWIANGYAESFRDYIENPTRAHDTVNIRDENALSTLLSQVEKREETIH